MNKLLVKTLPLQEQTMYEEDSYYFLQYYQSFQDWHIYDSDHLGVPTVQYLAEQFSTFHGKIPFLKEQVPIDDSFWSTIPLGFFRYKLLSDGSFGDAQSYSRSIGYIVEGPYWENGFFYVVRDQSDIKQIRLFVDSYTYRTRNYPDPNLI